MALNLLYRIKRFFQGESGVVERVESVEVQELLKKARGLSYGHYYKDECGKIPRRVFFRNPLGELVSDITPTELIEIDNLGLKPNYSVRQYKQYKIGDKFP